MTARLLCNTPSDLAVAGQLLHDGELVAIPTETVYGLAANAYDEVAVGHIFEAKGRPQDNPLIVHITQLSEWAPLVQSIPETAMALAKAFWPGPLTIILPKSERISDAVSAGLPTVAVRMPSHPIARAVIQASGCPLAAPSANRSGRPSPTTAAHVMYDLGDRIAAVVDGGECAVGLESTVVAVNDSTITLLRPGGITPEMLSMVSDDVRIAGAVTAPLKKGEKASSPGMKYKHYAPRTQVVIVKGTADAYIRLVNEKAAQSREAIGALCFEEDTEKLHVPCVTYGKRQDAASQAHRLFEALREVDELHVSVAYAACPVEDGVGLAVYNRLLRAAGFEVITVE